MVHPDDDLNTVVARADTALYRGKQTRATVCIAPPSNVPSSPAEDVPHLPRNFDIISRGDHHDGDR